MRNNRTRFLLAKNFAQVISFPKTSRFEDFSARGIAKLPAVLAQKDEEEIPNKDLLVKIGRSWKINELRLKNNEDLHKLWYVFIKEKNRLLSDTSIIDRMTGKKMPKSRMQKLLKSMRRITYIITERQNVCNAYRKHLEDVYCTELKDKLKDNYQEFKNEHKLSPPISYSLLRAKFEALRKKKDDLKYIEGEVSLEDRKIQLKDYLRERYAYGKKKFINPENTNPEKLKSLNKDDYIMTFKNQIEVQLSENKTRMSQEEVLRAHVKNWKVLNLKQRRVVLHYLNDRRSKDAKSAFIKELNLLAQKIAYEEKNMAKD